MTRVIRISEESFDRLKKLAIPLEDTPSTVIDRLLDWYESHASRGHSKAEKSSRSATPMKDVHDPSRRLPRQRGTTVKVDDQTMTAHTLSDLYEQVMKYLCKRGYIERLRPHLPLATSGKRYLIARKPQHPSGKEFFIPVVHNGFYMEAHKDYKVGIKHLKKMLDLCGVSFEYMR